MGKVHRIKRDFWRIVNQEPLPVGRHVLGHTYAGMLIGRRFHDGSTYLLERCGFDMYKPLVRQLIKQYEAGVAHSDKGPVTG